MDEVNQLHKSAWMGLARVDEPEWLDLYYGSQQDVERNLLEMERINRILGGLRALAVHLYPRIEQLGGPLSLADYGTGSGGVPRAVSAWAACRGIDLRFLCLDIAGRNLSVARHRLASLPQSHLVQADIRLPPFAPASADLVISTLVLHHFAPADLAVLLRSAFEHSRHGIIMSDLVRGWLPYAAFRLVQPVFARHPFTRHDGALSIRRAYRPEELLAVARDAGLPKPRVYTHFPWRMTLVVEK